MRNNELKKQLLYMSEASIGLEIFFLLVLTHISTIINNKCILSALRYTHIYELYIDYITQ